MFTAEKKRNSTVQKLVKSRNFKNVSQDEFTKSFSSYLTDRLNYMANLNQSVRVFEDEMTLMMDNLAPEKTKIVTQRKLNIWYNDEINNQKKVTQKMKIPGDGTGATMHD